MIGVYLIRNKINQKSYVGISKDIIARWKGHIYESRCPTQKGYDKALYRAFRKYGIDNFSFEILEECQTIDEMNEREIYWISKLDTQQTGYNETSGGQGTGNRQGENNGRAKLTEQDVIDIRIARKNMKNRSEVYQLYQDKLTFLSFRNVWQGVNWKHIMPEIYTSEALTIENRGAVRANGSRNPNSKLLEQDVFEIRIRKNKGEIAFQVYQDYKMIIGTTAFYSIWNNVTWKHVIIEGSE